MNLLRLEYFKIRRKKIGLMILLFLAVEMLWTFLSVSRSIARNPDHAVWESVLFTIASMNGLFMPIVSAIVVSRVCDMEHRGDTWKMLAATNVSRAGLYAAKYMCANSLLFFGLLGQALLMIAFGFSTNMSEAPPIGMLVGFLAGAMLTTFAVTALQQWISLAVKNQTFALCLGMLGGLIGMTSGLFPAAFRHVLVWSYYLDLSPVTYRYADSSGIYMVQPMEFGIVAAALTIALLFYTAGSLHVARQEI
ncbi:MULTISPECIES: ABC transporter permease [Paenibacillus]|uniref:ABC transporter permease n=1 Tax=Paenibacillus TaxID=44249 RepID=UPI002FE038F6